MNANDMWYVVCMHVYTDVHTYISTDKFSIVWGSLMLTEFFVTIFINLYFVTNKQKINK